MKFTGKKRPTETLMNEKEYHMNYNNAWKTIQEYHEAGDPKKDTPAFEEACQYLVDNFDDGNVAVDLATQYYRDEKYNLALKYYSYAAEKCVPFANTGLGYIYYFGRLGKPDYQKAYECFTREAELITGIRFQDEEIWKTNPETILIMRSPADYAHYITVAYLLAQMYRNGYYVKKDYSRFSFLIRQLYNMMTNRNYPPLPDYYLPVVETEMSEIVLHNSKSKKNKGTALKYLYDARNRISERLLEEDESQDFQIMKDIILHIRKIGEPDSHDMDLYDLYYLVQKPCTVSFSYNGHSYHLSAEKEGEDLVIRLKQKIYHSLDEFMCNGRIGKDRVSFAAGSCHDISVIYMGKE